MTIQTPLTPESAMELARTAHRHSPAWCPTCEAIRDLILKVDQESRDQAIQVICGPVPPSDERYDGDGFSCMDAAEFSREHACPGNGCCKRGD